MMKRYQIELDRNERDFSTFLKSREVTLSKTDLKVLIAAQAVEDQDSLFDIERLKKLTISKNIQTSGKRILRASFEKKNSQSSLY